MWIEFSKFNSNWVSSYHWMEAEKCLEKALKILHKEPLPLCFDQVSEKYNGWIKSYRVKTVILTILGAFWPLLAPLRTRDLTESRQTVHFQVLKHLNLSSTLWKTTRKTYILTFCNFEKTPQKGVFWALKSPEGREPEFCQGLRHTFYMGSDCLHVLTKFRKNTMDGAKGMN